MGAANAAGSESERLVIGQKPKLFRNSEVVLQSEVYKAVENPANQIAKSRVMMPGDDVEFLVQGEKHINGVSVLRNRYCVVDRSRCGDWVLLNSKQEPKKFYDQIDNQVRVEPVAARVQIQESYIFLSNSTDPNASTEFHLVGFDYNQEPGRVS